MYIYTQTYIQHAYKKHIYIYNLVYVGKNRRLNIGWRGIPQRQISWIGINNVTVSEGR